MSDFYDDESAEEHAEIVAQLDAAVQALTVTADTLTQLKESNDTGSMSTDAYTALVDMLRQLNNNYDIEGLVQSALEADE